MFAYSSKFIVFIQLKHLIVRLLYFYLLNYNYIERKLQKFSGEHKFNLNISFHLSIFFLLLFFCCCIQDNINQSTIMDLFEQSHILIKED